MSKIKFVREYEYIGLVWVDVIYKTNRCRTYERRELPKTAIAFMDSASTYASFDSLFKRTEKIYYVE